MNPIIQQLGRSALNPQINQFRNLMQMARGNPSGVLESMMRGNPAYGQVMKLVNDNGGDPEKAFYALARQKGLDPDQLVKDLGIRG